MLSSLACEGTHIPVLVSSTPEWEAAEVSTPQIP